MKAWCFVDEVMV